MISKYPKFKRGEVENIYNNLSESEKKIIEDYLFYRNSRGLSENASKDLRRYLIHIRHIIDCDFKDVDNLDKLARLSVLIKGSYLSNEVKKNLRINLSNLFKYLFPDWISRFMSLDCFMNIKPTGEGSEQGILSDADMPTDKEIEDMLKSENSTFWKTFLLYQATTGLRTIETRTTEIKKITFENDSTARIEIFMTKTGKPKYVFTDRQTTDFIKKLIEEQKNTNQYGKYLFHSPTDKDTPIHKNSVNKWFHNLSKKATGRYIKPYWLRHKKATMLYKLAMNNVISKDVASKLMGHCPSMSERYTHMPKDKEIEILKKQAFNTEISPKRKAQLEEEILKVKEENKELKSQFQLLKDSVKLIQGQLKQDFEEKDKELLLLQNKSNQRGKNKK